MLMIKISFENIDSDMVEDQQIKFSFHVLLMLKNKNIGLLDAFIDDELESAGLVYKRRGAGTFVADVPSPLTRTEQKRILIERIDALWAEASRLGLPFDDVQELMHKRRKRLEQQSGDA